MKQTFLPYTTQLLQQWLSQGLRVIYLPLLFIKITKWQPCMQPLDLEWIIFRAPIGIIITLLCLIQENWKNKLQLIQKLLT